MGYLHDFRENLADELDEFELDDDARAAILDRMADKILESYRNGKNAAGSSAPRSSKKATSRKEK